MLSRLLAVGGGGSGISRFEKPRWSNAFPGDLRGAVLAMTPVYSQSSRQMRSITYTGNLLGTEICTYLAAVEVEKYRQPVTDEPCQLASPNITRAIHFHRHHCIPSAARPIKLHVVPCRSIIKCVLLPERNSCIATAF